MKTIVCYKSVADSESIKVARDRTLDMSEVQYEIGQYDLRAVEAGMQLAAKTGGEVIALTAAGEMASNSKMKKAILARGPQEMFGIQDTSLDSADTMAVAAVLKAGVEKIGCDLVLCGEGSGDMYAQQTGNILGGMLGWSTINAVCEIEPTGEATLRVKRVVGDGVETLDITLPAVISVTGDINVPRIPTMKDIMGAGKKPSTIWSLADIGASVVATTKTESVLAPEATERKRIILEGGSDEALDEFAAYLKKAL